eukprot:GCRY01000703.1.p1 GENE.GCRY01000703.1~~GCRY01000703.1.p1  ORF type:complete len:187 (+),score=29.31 GCRY01000703.1:120-680(+)
MDILENLRSQCLKRGSCGIKGLGRLFRIMDDDGNKNLNYEEFKEGLIDYGLKFDDEEFALLCEKFDMNKDGNIDINEFIFNIRPPMNERRKFLCEQAFNKLDKSGDGVVTVEDLKNVFSAKHHPKYIQGDYTEEDVFREYLKNFDSPVDPDFIVTKEEFLNYYAGVSASIEQDSYFDLMMRKAWNL